MLLTRLATAAALLLSGQIGAGLSLESTASGQAKQPVPADKAASLARHDGTVSFVAYTPDGKQIITITYEGAIRKWDATSGKELQQLEKAINAPGAMFDTRCRVASLSPDGKTLAVATYLSVVNLYNVTSGKQIRFIKTGDDQMSGAGGVGFAADSKSIFTNRFQGREVTHWDAASGKELHKVGEALKGFNIFGLSVVSASPNGKVVASVAAEMKNGQRAGMSVKRWEVATGKELPAAKGPGEGSVVFATDGKTAAWNDPKASTIRLWNLETDKEVRPLEGNGTARVFSNDGKLIAGRDKDQASCIWDVSTGKVLRTFGGPPAERPTNARPDSAAFSADGKKLVTGFGYEVHQWDVATGKEIGPGAQK